jgi:hypothetical protein
MLRWISSKTSSGVDAGPTDAVTESKRRHAVVRRGDTLEGWVSWPEDPFFRPSIGLFVNRSLIGITPSFRAADGSKLRLPEWRNIFNIVLDRDIARERIELTCLETGELLFRSPEVNREKKNNELAIDDILDIARLGRSEWNANGFLEFLSLSISDQLQILFLDLLNRDVDHDGLDAYDKRIRSGMTILDVRDEIFTSREFWLQRGKGFSVDERVGQWLVWGGLSHVLPHVIPHPVRTGNAARRQRRPRASMPVMGSLEQLGSATDAVGYLTRLALGAERKEELRLGWQSAHASTIGDILAETERRKASYAGDCGPLPGRVMVTGMLSTMQTGGAGSRDRKTGYVRSRINAGGTLVYGPYIRLESGQYNLLVEFDETTGETEHNSADAPLFVEAVYGDLLLGWGEVLPNADAQDPVFALEFSIPSYAKGLLTNAKFEFRIQTDGHRLIEVRSMELERVEKMEEPAYPAVKDWLRLLKLGPAGTAAFGGRIVRAPAGHDGHVVYGLFRSFLPGDYLFTVHYDDAKPVGANAALRLELLGSNEQILVSKEFTLTAEAGSFEIEHSIANVKFFEDLSGPVQFRIWKNVDSSFAIKAIEVSRRPTAQI